MHVKEAGGVHEHGNGKNQMRRRTVEGRTVP